MAGIKSLRRDMAKVNEGEWRRLYLDTNPDKDGYVLTKGVSTTYQDALNRRLSSAAKSFNGQVGKIPTAQANRIEVDASIECLFRDVRGLQLDDGGTDLTFAEFCDLIRQPDYRQLFLLASAAAAAVGVAAEEATAEAVGN
jgi:hypothetical protein